MMWNWKYKEWPQFIFDKDDFMQYEQEFLHKSGVTQGSIKHIHKDDQEALKIELISDEALRTSEIEGEILNRDSLQSSIRKHFGLKTDHRKIPAAEQGIAEMMFDLYTNYDIAFSHKTLFEWHSMLMNGRRDLENIGSYRTHEEPMQIVSGSLGKPIIHYEAPPSLHIPQEMDRFIEWVNHTSLPPLLHAGVAHLYFESIHPFEDGNGRIGRAISEKILSQNLKRPTLIAISHTINNDKKSYYSALHTCSKNLEIVEWLDYFCNMVLKAQDYTQSIIDFLINKGKFYLAFDAKLNERQAKVVARIFREGLDGFKGGLSAENYISITGVSRATATRDLQKLAECGAFTKKGERKGTRYYLNFEHPNVQT